MTYYSIKDVADLLQCDPETVRRRIRSGKLKAIKLNGRVKILEEDLIAMLKESALGIEFDGKSLKEILNYI